jgi:dihydroorotase
MEILNLTQADDWHIHLRDGDYLAHTVKDAAQQFKRAIVMPNLRTPVTSVAAAKSYYQRILHHIPPGSDFQPLMTLYLTDQTTPQTIEAAYHSGLIYACKLYPAGATTYSEAGVTRLEKIYDTLSAMAEYHLPLLMHGEVVDPEIDIFDREAVFLTRHLTPLVEKFPKLKMVLEHISTTEAVDFILQAPQNVAATITAHHLLLSRNDLLAGGLRPHHYCLPIVKRYSDQQALLNAATSGNPKFFLGTDSAPHPVGQKQSSCGCAGIYTALAALPLYAQAFEDQQALNKLEGFASFYGADFYGLPRNKQLIQLKKSPWNVPQTLDYASNQLIPFKAGTQLNWQLSLV